MKESGETIGEKSLPTNINGFAIDLVRKSMGINNSLVGEVFELNSNARLEDNEGEIELSLGLSLNGKFGVDPKRTQLKLIRASSVSTLTLNGVEAPPLIRTCSLPSVMEEELRKRKDLQSVRLVEAKRRRMDELMFSKEMREKNDSDLGSVCNNIDGVKPVLQGSELGSQGSGGSSGVSELESNSIQDKCPYNITHSQMAEHELKVPSNPGKSNIHSRHSRADHKPPIPPRDKPSSVVATGTEKERMQLNGLKNDRPFVTTKDKGPNGKRMEGFLYRYQKGDVKIVCVCHGSMFSPAEFVRHGGGGDVEHPLRHIVVSSRPF